MNKIDRLVEETIKLMKQERYKLQEMAQTKQYISTMLEQSSYKIIEHLICCYLWSESDSVLHCKTEIVAILPELPSLKGTNRKPTFKQLDKWYLQDRKDRIKEGVDTYVENTCYKENKSIPTYDSYSLVSYLQDYFTWMCETLSQGRMKTSDVSKKIDELINKYNKVH